MNRSTEPAGCEYCNRSALSLLLLRPSPIGQNSAHAKLAPAGSERVLDAGALVNGLVPARAPTQSRYVLRLLRAGYVHVYVPSPPPRMAPWWVWRVLDNGDLLAQNISFFNKELASPLCTSSAHNAAGMKLLALPKAHLLDSVWIAYSANLWSDRLKAQNAADPRVMQQVSLRGGSANTFAPTAERLGAHVLECAALNHRLPDTAAGEPAVEPEFSFARADAQALATMLARAAQGHPQTEGRQQAVVLADPVGLAAEFNAIRLARHRLAQRHLARPEHAHPLASAQMIEGLRQSVVDSTAARAFDAISPLMTRGAFEDAQRVKPHPRGWPPGTQWETLTPFDDPTQALARYGHGHGVGRVVFPDHEERAARWAQQQSAATFERWRRYVDEPRLQAWRSGLEQTLQAAHGVPLAAAEADWWAAREDERFANYFALHFDEREPNEPDAPYTPRSAHSAGLAYLREVERGV
jgi:hypothetical protein